MSHLRNHRLLSRHAPSSLTVRTPSCSIRGKEISVATVHAPFALVLFTGPTDVPTPAIAPSEYFDSELQLTVRADGTPRVADAFEQSRTCGGMTSGTEVEMMDVFPGTADLW